MSVVKICGGDPSGNLNRNEDCKIKKLQYKLICFMSVKLGYLHSGSNRGL